jgi:hypothetical protein
MVRFFNANDRLAATSVVLIVMSASTTTLAFQPSRLVHRTAGRQILLHAVAVDSMLETRAPIRIVKQTPENDPMQGVAFSGLRGKAMRRGDTPLPTASQLRSVIPADCFQSDTLTSLKYLSVSTIGTVLCTAVGMNLINLLPPDNILLAPFWMAYAAVTGTVAMGLWVLAHECGHGAFSPNKKLQDTGTCRRLSIELVVKEYL